MLVVDDSPTICAALGKMLGGEDYAVQKAGEGRQAIALARSEQPALIFLDVVMPGMNGYNVVRKLRHDPLTADISIIMVNGNQQATEPFYLQRDGADDFMKKPFGRDEAWSAREFPRWWRPVGYRRVVSTIRLVWPRPSPHPADFPLTSSTRFPTWRCPTQSISKMRPR